MHMWSRVYVFDRIYVIIYICVYKLLRDFNIECFPFRGKDLGGHPHIFVRMALSPSLFQQIFIVDIPIGDFDFVT